jgi:hypothetical protein
VSKPEKKLWPGLRNYFIQRNGGRDVDDYYLSLLMFDLVVAADQKRVTAKSSPDILTLKPMDSL